MLFATLALAGCTRCVNCSDCPAGAEPESGEYCENDFNSKEDFDQQIAIIEGFGCTCMDI
ncbi:MAG: hypothetical protein AAF570_06755 [Bacteroidota bacterium]